MNLQSFRNEIGSIKFIKWRWNVEFYKAMIIDANLVLYLCEDNFLLGTASRDHVEIELKKKSTLNS